MEKVITINDWWDSPLLGLAYYNGIVCIYERVFSETDDEYIDEYILTPISKEEEIAIMCEWKEWCDAVSCSELDLYYKKHSKADKIINVITRSAQKEKHRKKARFSGVIGNGCIPVDYHVEWYD